MGHGPRTFIPNENLNWTKEKNIQNLVIPRLVILLGGGEVVGGATKSSFQLHMLKEYKIEAHIFEIGLKNSLQAQDNIIHLRGMYPCGLFIHCNLLRLWLQTTLT